MSAPATQIGDLLGLALVGMIIVIVVLAGIAGFLALLRWSDHAWQAREARQRAAQIAAPDAIDHTTLVLLSAAVATVLAGRGRVRRIRRVVPGDAPRSAWGMQGRLLVQGSHLIGRGEQRRRR